MYAVFPIGTPQFGDAINLPGPRTKRYRKELFLPCLIRDCSAFATFPPDVEVYNIQNTGFYNTDPVSVLVNCPTGYVCPPGDFPKVFTYPPGTFVIPDPGPCNGFPIVLEVVGCSSTIIRSLPCGSTPAQIQAIANSMIALAAQQQGVCDAIKNFPQNPSPKFLNETQYVSITCTSPDVIAYFGTLPSYITLDTSNNRVVLASGVIAGNSQAEANQSALNFLSGWKLTAVENNTLRCQHSGSFPDMVYTAIAGNGGELVSATINGQNFLAGLPANGSSLGNYIQADWEVFYNPSTPGYTIVFHLEDTLIAGEDGTYRVSIDNQSLVELTFDPCQVLVYVNAVLVYTYDLNSTSGLLSTDLPLVSGDVLLISFEVDGTGPTPATYQTLMQINKL